MTGDFLSLLTADAAAERGNDDGKCSKCGECGNSGAGDNRGESGSIGESVEREDLVRAIAFECLISGIIDERAASVLRVAGFDGDFACFAFAGHPTDRGGASSAIAIIRQAVHDLGGSEPLIGVHDGAVVALVRLEAAVSPDATCTASAKAFDPSAPICLGQTRRGIKGASVTMRAALTTLTAAPALSSIMLHTPPASSRAAQRTAVLHAEDALPERAMLGEQEARRELVEDVYMRLLGNSDNDDPTMLTVATFLKSGGSLEVTARSLNVHPNTVRYRLKRMADTTGWDVTDQRDAFVLTCAISLGRIAHSRS